MYSHKFSKQMRRRISHAAVERLHAKPAACWHRASAFPRLCFPH